MDILVGIVLLFWVIALLVFYHKVFTVYYFSLSKGLMQELITAAILGAIMTGLTFLFWWLTAIIIIIVGLVNMSKSGNKAHIVVAIILAIVIAVIGISATGSKNTSSEEALNTLVPASTYEYII
jgi:hypothetical protein